jgi:hypothetical protein
MSADLRRQGTSTAVFHRPSAVPAGTKPRHEGLPNPPRWPQATRSDGEAGRRRRCVAAQDAWIDATVVVVEAAKRRGCKHAGVYGTEDERRPDFAALFLDHAFVTPRMACRLWMGAQFCGDTWRLEDGDPAIALTDLPPITHRWAVGAWLDRFIESFDLIERRLAAGDVSPLSLTRCTGEEMALHLVIDHAEGDLDSGIDASGGQIEQLPDLGGRDHDFELMRDVLLRDLDVLLLFDMRLDGIEDPSSEVARLEGTANLHPAQWFLPFDDVEEA